MPAERSTVTHDRQRRTRSQMIAAIFDFDGTMVRKPVWQRLTVRMLRERVNLGPVLAHTLYHYPQYPLTKIRLVDRRRLRRAWAEHMPWLVRGLPVAEAKRLFDRLAREDLLPDARPEVLERVAHHRRQGHLVVLLSGALQPLLEAFAPLVGIDAVLGTQLEIRAGAYTGRLVAPSTYGPGKVVRLTQFLEEQTDPVDLSRSYAYADSLSDEPLLRLVGRPIAVAPEPGLRAIAERSAWGVIG